MVAADARPRCIGRTNPHCIIRATRERGALHLCGDILTRRCTDVRLRTSMMVHRTWARARAIAAEL